MNKLKLSLVAFLALAGLAVSVSDSQAWYGWCGRHRLEKYSTVICCRPYNAFTPCCFGSITCNGCCPVIMQPPAMPGYGGWMPGSYGFAGYAGAPNGCGEGGYPGMPMPYDPTGGMGGAMPQGPMCPLAPPAAGVPIQQQGYMMPQQPLQTMAPQPGYQVPGYYVQPVSYYPQWPNQPVVPSYWYGR
jgi:hypothetical protein